MVKECNHEDEQSILPIGSMSPSVGYAERWSNASRDDFGCGLERGGAESWSSAPTARKTLTIPGRC